MTTSPSQEPAPPTEDAAPRFSVRRLIPLLVVVLATGTILAMGWHRQLSFETLVRHRAALHDFIAANMLEAIGAYMALYITVVSLSLPAGAFLTVVSGSLFGPLIGPSVSIVSATIGAICLFLIARTAVGEHLVRRAGPMVGRLADGFRADAFHYLLFLRLVPLVPFFVVNIVPAVCGVGLMPFVVATAIGIIPASFAYGFAGAGLDSMIRAQEAPYNACLAAGRSDCRLDFDLRAAITPEVLAALVALGIIALIPILLRWRRDRARVADRSG